jgi:hypothetical protein
MVLPSSGPLTLANIQTEFGGSNPISLSEYYAGGGLVPAGTSGTFGAVPSSGAIGIRNFYGTSNIVISISNQTITGSATSSAGAWYYLTSGGQVQGSTIFGGTSPFFIENWVTPTSAAADYEAFITVTSGSLTGGTTGSWVALSSTRSWYIQSTSTGTTTCVFTVQIRQVGTATVLDTATITLNAEVSD